jgi:hypothetical protein
MNLLGRIEQWADGSPKARALLARWIAHDAPLEESARYRFKPTPRGEVILPPRLRPFHALFLCKHPGRAQTTTEWTDVELGKVRAACFCGECGKLLTEVSWTEK